jgi:hypothetical protein
MSNIIKVDFLNKSLIKKLPTTLFESSGKSKTLLDMYRERNNSLLEKNETLAELLMEVVDTLEEAIIKVHSLI